jgi:hypothetical protein
MVTHPSTHLHDALIIAGHKVDGNTLATEAA